MVRSRNHSLVARRISTQVAGLQPIDVIQHLNQCAAGSGIPMHFGSMGGVEAFIAKARKLWPVRRHSESWIQLSFRGLPHRTELLFLKGGN